MKHCYLQCKQFQFVNSMLFGQVRRAVFESLSKYFWSKDGSARVRFDGGGLYVYISVLSCKCCSVYLLNYLCLGAGKQRFCRQTVEVSSRQKQDGKGEIICNGFFLAFDY